ncbi:12743_t:CDS:2 [Entrophospora sp. SA101]|nr:19544_t:CDS:2 [Entrophospora sp. SA101]CAJ0864465.1 12743_t:CDS:2 [Entrophospora sp. SA101]
MSSMLIKREEMSPVLIKREETSPVSIKIEKTSPVLIKREEISPVLIKREETSPMLIKREETSPVLIKREETPLSMLIKREEISLPMLTNDEISHDEITKEEGYPIILISNNNLFQGNVNDSETEEFINEELDEEFIDEELIGEESIDEVITIDVQWLVEHPNVLQLANNLLLKNQLLKKSISESRNSSIVPNNISEDLLNILDEEVKCLFLRVRFPIPAVMERLVKAIFNFDTRSQIHLDMIKKTRSKFCKARCSYNKGIVIGHDVNRQEVTRYIVTESVACKLLSRYTTSTDYKELKRNGSLKMAITLVQETVLLYWNGKNPRALFTLEHITSNIIVPSKSGRNIASSLILD